MPSASTRIIYPNESPRCASRGLSIARRGASCAGWVLSRAWTMVTRLTRTWMRLPGHQLVSLFVFRGGSIAIPMNAYEILVNTYTLGMTSQIGLQRKPYSTLGSQSKSSSTSNTFIGHEQLRKWGWPITLDSFGVREISGWIGMERGRHLLQIYG